MFYATWRESKCFKYLIGSVLAVSLIFYLFSPSLASAAVTWEGTGSGQSIEDVIGESLNGGLYSFGWSIDADGGTVVVGYPNYQDESGAAFILQYDEVSGTWTRLARLSISDPEAGGRFGWDVAIEGETVVVSGHNGASVYIFTKPAGGWTDLSTDDAVQLISTSNDTWFGHSVDIVNDTIVVGAPSAGSLYVYKKPVDGWVNTSSSLAILPGVVNGAWTGYSVAISKDAKVIVSGDAQTNTNEVLVFSDLSGDWSSFNTTRLIADNLASTAVFGMSVAVSDSGDTVVVGARHDKNSIECDGGWGPGAAYIFESPGASWSNGTIFANARLTASDPNCQAVLGESVAIKDNMILVGSPWFRDEMGKSGAIYVYAKPADGWVDATENVKLLDAEVDTAGFRYFGEDSVFVNNSAFSISPMSPNGSTGFSTFAINEPYATFLSTPTVADNGYATGTVSVLDLKNNPVKVYFKYSTDQIEWNNPTIISADDENGQLNLDTTTDPEITYVDITDNAFGHEFNFVWDSVADGVGENTLVYLQVIPVNGEESAESFVINNSFSVFSPTGLSAANITTTSLELFWNALSGASSYTVSSTATEDSVVTNSTSTLLAGLNTNTQYDFKVMATNGAGTNSVYSNVFSVYTLANTPANFAVSGVTENEITLTWDGDATSYYAELLELELFSGWITEKNYSFNGLSCGTDYRVQVAGNNGDGIKTDLVSTTARTADCAPVASANNTSSGGSGSYTPPPVVTTSTASTTPITTTSTVTTTQDGVGGPGPDENDQEQNSGDNNNSASGSPTGVNGGSPTNNAGGRPVVVSPGNNISAVSGNTDNKPLEIQLPATSDNSGLVPAAQAGAEGSVFGTKARWYFSRVFNSENNWIIVLAAILAVVIIIVGWFAYQWKKGNKNADNPIVEVKKEEQDGIDKK